MKKSEYIKNHQVSVIISLIKNLFFLEKNDSKTQSRNFKTSSWW